MATEKGIVSSSVVLSIASRTLHVPTSSCSMACPSPPRQHVPAEDRLFQPAPSTRRSSGRRRSRSLRDLPDPAAGRAAQQGKIDDYNLWLTTPARTLITLGLAAHVPVQPEARLGLYAALLVGLSLGIGTAAIRDRLNDRLRGPADLEACTAAPLLALDPGVLVVTAQAGNPARDAPPAESVVADAYRSLRTRIVQAAASIGREDAGSSPAPPGRTRTRSRPTWPSRWRSPASPPSWCARTCGGGRRTGSSEWKRLRASPGCSN